MEKQYECQCCKHKLKNKNEAERHQNSLHLRRHSWSCAALHDYSAAFHNSPTRLTEADICGYCGEEFLRTAASQHGMDSKTAMEHDQEARIQHLLEVHKFRECNHAKKFFRADHFRQHLKHSHSGTSGKWTSMLENACMKEEPLPEPNPARINPTLKPIGFGVSNVLRGASNRSNATVESFGSASPESRPASLAAVLKCSKSAQLEIPALSDAENDSEEDRESEAVPGHSLLAEQQDSSVNDSGKSITAHYSTSPWRTESQARLPEETNLCGPKEEYDASRGDLPRLLAQRKEQIRHSRFPESDMDVDLVELNQKRRRCRQVKDGGDSYHSPSTTQRKGVDKEVDDLTAQFQVQALSDH
jgi:hypothetical protein